MNDLSTEMAPIGGRKRKPCRCGCGKMTRSALQIHGGCLHPALVDRLPSQRRRDVAPVRVAEMPCETRLPAQTGEDRTDGQNVDSGAVSVRWEGIVAPETRTVRGYTAGELFAIGAAGLVALYVGWLCLTAQGVM